MYSGLSSRVGWTRIVKSSPYLGYAFCQQVRVIVLLILILKLDLCTQKAESYLTKTLFYSVDHQSSLNLKSSVARKGILTAPIVELLQSKAARLQALEIHRDNLATAAEVGLKDLVELRVRLLTGFKNQ